MELKRLVTPLEVKAVDEATGTFTGYGSVFGNVDSYGDVVVPGAFAKTLREKPLKKIKLLWQHDSREPIGVYTEIKEDERGLFVRGQLAINTVQRAKEAYGLLEIGAIEGLSIGFTVNPGGIRAGDNGENLLTDINLWEISLVTFPANPIANVSSIKSIEDIQTIRDFERFLRDAGFSNQKAKAIAANGFKAISTQRDVEEDKAVEDLTNLIDQFNKTIKERFK